MLIQIIIATFIVSLAAFIGIIVANKKIEKFLHYMISFSAAALIAASLLDLIPHAIEELESAGSHSHDVFLWVVMGITLFFIIEKIIHWHHCGKHDCKRKPFGSLILFGDFVHNFLDGVLIAGAFMLDFKTGIITSFIVLIHEIPQEFGDFAVLIHAGFNKKRALFLNFVSALSAVIGGIAGYFIFGSISKIMPYAVLVAAGGFLYIALSDIMPSMHKHKEKRKSILEIIIFILTLVGFRFFLEVLH